MQAAFQTQRDKKAKLKNKLDDTKAELDRILNENVQLKLNVKEIKIK